MINSLKNNFFIYLLFLTPFLIIPGIFVIELSVFSITLFFLYKNRSIEYFKDLKFIFLLLFSIYVAINALLQVDDNLRFSSFFFFRFCVFSLAIVFILDFYKKFPIEEKKGILSIFAFLIFFLIFDSYFQFFTGQNLFGFNIENNTISSIFGSELILGSFLLKLLPIIIFIILYLRIDLRKHFFKLVIFLSLYFSVTYIAGGRTPFFLIILFVFSSIIIIKNLRTIFYLSTLFLTLFILLTFFFDIGKTNPGNRMFIKTLNLNFNLCFCFVSPKACV